MPLATVQKVLAITPIPGADSIEVVSVMGWQCVAKKGDFKVGDYGVYIEIDSIVPDKPEFAFMKERHFRVRTVKLRGQLSQGLFMPARILAGLKPDENGDGAYLIDGYDVTDLLGIVKYEKEIPAELRGRVKGTRPSFIPKTDEDRIQSSLNVLFEIKDLPVYVTVKCDGSSCTFFYRKSPELEKGEFGVCSRSMLYDESDTNSFCNTARALGIHEKMEKYGRNLAIQGELVGPGIQKNKMGLTELKFLAFNVLDIDNQRYLGYEESQSILKALELTPVPLVAAGKTLDELLGLGYTIGNLLDYADGTYENGELREGIVIRPMEEKYSMALRGRMSFKVVSNKFLEKWKE